MATHLADTSVLARLHHDDVAARLHPMFLAGRIATCAVVDLEVLVIARSGAEHAELAADRRLLPRAPITEACTDRAIEVQGLLVEQGRERSVSIRDLLVAAAAELAGLTLLHYDRNLEVIAGVTGQPTEWVVPAGTVP